MDASKKTLGQLIFHEHFTKYSIPIYQRPYKWGKDQIEDFWTDLTDGKINFIGPIVVQKSEKNIKNDNGKVEKMTIRTIVDGQQRLITSTIFASVLRDVYFSLSSINNDSNLSDRSNLIQSRYIISLKLDASTKDYRLQTAEKTSIFLKPFIQNNDIISKFLRVSILYDSKRNKNNSLISDEFYDRIYKKQTKHLNIIKDKDEKEHERALSIKNLIASSDEHKRIRENYILLYENVMNHIKSEKTLEEKSNKLNELLTDLTNMEIVEMSIDDENSAYEIFERLNNYGIDLTQADLLKNWVLKNIEKEKDQEKCLKDWFAIENNVGEKDLTSFIRYYWMSRNPFTPKNQLYKSISESKRDAQELMEELKSASQLYKQLTDTSFKFQDLKTSTKKSKDLSDTINSLKDTALKIGSTQINTFLLSIISIINRKKLKSNPQKFLILLENFLFQYFAIGSNPANAVERKFSSISNLLEKSLADKDKLVEKNQDRLFKTFTIDFKNILKQNVNEENFKETFKQLEYVTFSKSRKKYEINKYILEKYEYYLMQSIGKSTNEIALKLSNLNKEHLLPQKPDKWGLTSKDVESYVNSLGNIFLIDIDLNTKMRNDALDKKIKLLKKSSLLSIKEVYHNKKDVKWGKKEIEERLDNITNAAWDSIWNID